VLSVRDTLDAGYVPRSLNGCRWAASFTCNYRYLQLEPSAEAQGLNCESSRTSRILGVIIDIAAICPSDLSNTSQRLQDTDYICRGHRATLLREQAQMDSSDELPCQTRQPCRLKKHVPCYGLCTSHQVRQLSLSRIFLHYTTSMVVRLSLHASQSPTEILTGGFQTQQKLTN
jgi:hypothetical protein